MPASCRHYSFNKIKKAWHRPTFPSAPAGSIIGAGGLNFRVRNGIGCFPAAMGTRLPIINPIQLPVLDSTIREPVPETVKGRGSRPISTAQLHPLPGFHLRPIYLVVSQGPYWLYAMGGLILGWASRLDAFSGYPVDTWLPSDAPGGTAGTPEVSPLRSSRTRSSSPQASCARGG